MSAIRILRGLSFMVGPLVCLLATSVAANADAIMERRPSISQDDNTPPDGADDDAAQDEENELGDLSEATLQLLKEIAQILTELTKDSIEHLNENPDPFLFRASFPENGREFLAAYAKILTLIVDGAQKNRPSTAAPEADATAGKETQAPTPQAKFPENGRKYLAQIAEVLAPLMEESGHKGSTGPDTVDPPDSTKGETSTTGADDKASGDDEEKRAKLEDILEALAALSSDKDKDLSIVLAQIQALDKYSDDPAWQEWLEDIGEWIPVPVSLLGFVGLMLMLVKVRQLHLSVEEMKEVLEAITEEMALPPKSSKPPNS